MNKSNFSYLRHCLKKYSANSTGELIDINRILFELETYVNVDTCNKSTDEILDAIIIELDKTYKGNLNLEILIQFSLINLIDLKLAYYKNYYDNIKKACIEMEAANQTGEEYWLSSWSHERTLDFEKYMISLQKCTDNWNHEIELLRKALSMLILSPPYISRHDYYDLLKIGSSGNGITT